MVFGVDRVLIASTGRCGSKRSRNATNIVEVVFSQRGRPGRARVEFHHCCSPQQSIL